MDFWGKIVGVILHRIDFEIAENQIFSIGDLPTITVPIPKERYLGIYISKDKGKITVGICLLKDYEFSYKKDDVISLAFSELRHTHVFTGKIADISEKRREFKPAEIERVAGLIDESLMELYQVIEISVIVLSSPKPHDRRDYVRHYSPPWTVYFKIRSYDIDADDIDSDKVHAISSLQESLIGSGKFQIENGYCVVRTLDISAGGFRCKVAQSIPANTEIDCLVLADGKKIPAIGLVLACSPDPQNTDTTKYFQIRVQFVDISQTARNEILKNVIAQERMKRRGSKS